MPNETIILRFVEYAPALAEAMTRYARTFAASYTDRPAGIRHGVVARFDRGPYVVAYWTRARAVVVRELPADEATP